MNKRRDFRITEFYWKCLQIAALSSICDNEKKNIQFLNS